MKWVYRITGLVALALVVVSFVAPHAPGSSDLQERLLGTIGGLLFLAVLVGWLNVMRWFFGWHRGVHHRARTQGVRGMFR